MSADRMEWKKREKGRNGKEKGIQEWSIKPQKGGKFPANIF